MDGLEMFIPSEVSQREKNKSHMIPLICGIFFFFLNTIELIYNTKIDPQTRKQLMVTKRERERRDKLRV